MYLSLYDTEHQTKTCKDKQEYFLQRAANIAIRSNVRHHRHGCVIVRDGEVVSEGYNHHTSHYEHKFTVHAEVDALLKLKKNKKFLSECELYVVRIGTDLMGNPLKYSRPCCDCTRAILKAGIKKVYFSTDEEFNRIYREIYNHDHTRMSASSSSSSSCSC
jgi:deoxycytidylate deaminase